MGATSSTDAPGHHGHDGPHAHGHAHAAPLVAVAAPRPRPAPTPRRLDAAMWEVRARRSSWSDDDSPGALQAENAPSSVIDLSACALTAVPADALEGLFRRKQVPLRSKFQCRGERKDDSPWPGSPQRCCCCTTTG